MNNDFFATFIDGFHYQERKNPIARGRQCSGGGQAEGQDGFIGSITPSITSGRVVAKVATTAVQDVARMSICDEDLPK